MILLDDILSLLEKVLKLVCKGTAREVEDGRGKDPRCANCMAHCGYEPTAVTATMKSPYESLRATVDVVRGSLGELDDEARLGKGAVRWYRNNGYNKEETFCRLVKPDR